MSVTALTTADQQKYLQELRSEVGGSRSPQYPKIAMVNDKTEVKGMQKGEYYTSEQVKDDSGEYKTVTKSIGMSPEIVLLRRRYSYSLYSKSQEKLLAWTCELDDFKQEVCLVNNSTGTPTVEFSGSFKAFKEYAYQKYRDPVEGKNLLKFRNVFYVMYQGKVYRLFVSNASITGIPAGEKHGDYKNPQAESFLLFEKLIQAAEMHYTERVIRLGSKLKEGDSYYLMTFADAGENVQIGESIELRKQLDQDLKRRFVQDFGSLLEAQKKPVEFVEAEVLPSDIPTQEINPADLPF
jgi:hypothetical protein